MYLCVAIGSRYDKGSNMPRRARIYNVFNHYLDLQRKWEKMCRTTITMKEPGQECLALPAGFPLNSRRP